MFKGIITGLGNRGRYWVEQANQEPDCELVAYVEPAKALQKKAQEQLGLNPSKVFSSLDEAIKNVQADFVLDVTPPSVHEEIAEKAFAAGLHLIGEKPLSNDFAAAKRIVKRGREANVRHMITQNYRFNAQPRTTRKAIDDGVIGKPGQCDIKFYMNWADNPGSHYVTEPFMLINDMMVHHFDMMRYVLGSDPVAVQAITWNHAWGWHKGDAAHSIVFEFPDGLWATHVSVGCAVGERTNYNGDWRVAGPKGTITWDREGKMWHSHLHRADPQVNQEIFPVATEQTLLGEFFSAIQENRDPECSAQDNLKSLAMVFAAIKSSEEKRKVELKALS